MAELHASEKSGAKKNNGNRFKKKPTRVDLTPMVDLGFLLITFFIFTTTISQPTTMNLVLPQDPADPINRMPTKESGALTLMPSSNNLIYYYEGRPSNIAGNLFECSYLQLRDVILKKKRSVPEKDLFILIKPSHTSNFKNLVDLLDEMTINDIKRFALVDITNEEDELVVKK